LKTGNFPSKPIGYYDQTPLFLERQSQNLYLTLAKIGC
jgi:hypothetical protein